MKAIVNIRGALVDIAFPSVMGILNLTNDSFYSGSRVKHSDILMVAGKMIEDGAAILDIGAISTRPEAELYDTRTELERLLPDLRLIRKTFPGILISVDTFRSEVAAICADEGADIINDISGGVMDIKMFETVAAKKMPYILMHMQGTPQTMQQKPTYDNIIQDINYFFSKQVHLAKKHGIKDIFLDPGFGFGKTTIHNFEILKKLTMFQIHSLPVVVGLSRKSMIYKTLNTTPAGALTGTVSLNTIALLNNANILRVHDVREAVECIRLVEALKH